MNVRYREYQTGLSIAEMMISITIGLLILAGLTSVLLSNSRARTEIERSNRQIENGRYAMQLISDDLRLAGYLAEFSPSAMTLPVALPDPCATGLTDLNNALMLHVQGYDNPTTANIPSCLSDVKANTDILVIRRVSTCSAGASGCDAATNGTFYFQASLCSNSTELDTAITNNASYVGHYYMLDTTPANLTLHKRDCATLADLHRFITQIYFIANNDNPGDGIPTLKRAELLSSGGAPAFRVVPQVEGIDNLQLQYGIDSTLPRDGAPDIYKSNPANNTEWSQVVSVKINLLAKNTEATVGYVDQKTYTLGYDAAGATITYTPSGVEQTYKRHAYQSEVRLNNPAGRSM